MNITLTVQYIVLLGHARFWTRKQYSNDTKQIHCTHFLRERKFNHRLWSSGTRHRTVCYMV